MRPSLFGRKSARPVDASLPDHVVDGMEGSSGYPEANFVSGLRERRLLFSLRGTTFGLILSIILNVVLGLVIFSLMPLKEIRPFLMQVVDEGSVVATVKPIRDTFEAKDVLTEKLIREYVVNRHEILRSTPVMQSRWAPSGFLGTTTDSSEYNRFRAQVGPLLDEIRARDAQRRATILSVSSVRAGQVYVVDFRSTSYDKNDNVVDERVYTATIEIEFRPLSGLTKEQMLINPTGFTVLNYTLAEKDQ